MVRLCVPKEQAELGGPGPPPPSVLPAKADHTGVCRDVNP